MATPQALEFDFLPASYRASLEGRRRTLICLGGILVILAVGGLGLARQAVVLGQLLNLRRSLQAGLPGLEKAVREEQELAVRLAQATEKAESVVPILGGVPLQWVVLNVLRAVPENTVLERLTLELEEPTSTEPLAGPAAPAEGTSDQQEARLKQLLQRLDGATLKLSVSGQAPGMQDIQTFLGNLRATNLWQNLELERIEEVQAAERNPALRFVAVGRTPYQLYRLAQDPPATRPPAEGTRASGNASSDTAVQKGGR